MIKFLKNEFDRLAASQGLGITLRNNEIKGIIKATYSLEKKKILLKRTTKKVPSQKRGFLNVLGPLMKTGLLLMKNILTTLVKSVLVTLRLTAAASVTDAAIQKIQFWIENDKIDIFKWRFNIIS